MLSQFITENFKQGEPIFLSELPGNSRDYVRQEMKKLADAGAVERVYNGVYFASYTTILGTKGKMSVDAFVRKKYLRANGKLTGYETGLQLANRYGLTSQNSACYEVCSNEATTKQRKLDIDGQKVIVYKPVADVTPENVTALQFLDLMTNIDKYSELAGQELCAKLRELIEKMNVDFSQVKKYLPLYPDKVYRNLYEGGLMNELV